MFVVSYDSTSGSPIIKTRGLNSKCVTSDFVRSSDGHQFYEGCCFGVDADQLFSSGWQNNPKVLNTFRSALFIVDFDDTECTFAADTSGRELLFYYFRKGKLILSDSFWGIVEELDPSYDDIDWAMVSEMIACGGGVPCDNSLFVNGVRWLAPNTICRYNALSGNMTEEVFDEIRRSGEITDLDQAVESFDSAMKTMASDLVSKHQGEKFGLGLSGGLDSRVAYHYLKCAGIEPTCFNICVKRPHKVLKAKSVIQAEKLAKRAGVDVSFIEWNPSSIREKNLLHLKNQPFGTCGCFGNVYKYEGHGYPNIDVLVTAGNAIGPCLVGVSAPKGSKNLGRDDLLRYLNNLATSEVWPRGLTQVTVHGVLRKIGLDHVDANIGPNQSTWERFVPPSTYSRIADRVETFVDQRLAKGFGYADITMDYRTSALGAVGRMGAYESALGTKKSYTIYTPFLINEALKWDVSLVEERLVLKELIRKKVPEFVDVGEETTGSLSESQTRLVHYFDLLMFHLRGTGIYAAEWYANDPSIKEALRCDLQNDCGWFKEAYPAACDFDAIWGLSPSRMNSIWLLKRVIDCIESKAYLSFN
ncbi:hypothetical protein [Enorma phocaeensis]|uniref:Asparagine synthetase domain-containing protein n=1 Tax=Enorma phocaeensis TaxID=1871019 RepID=A0ABT7V8B7_9ACTN|nr:hypothetical protein [Enorma phocaeensis]MDM8274169.1 hypothetical protein [Enorma phocaeensis]